MGARFSMPVQNSPKAHSASWKVGTGTGPVSGVKWQGYGADCPLPFSAEYSNGLLLCLFLPSVPAQRCHGVTFTILVCLPI